MWLAYFLCTVVHLNRLWHRKELYNVGFLVCTKIPVRLAIYTVEHELKTV